MKRTATITTLLALSLLLLSCQKEETTEPIMLKARGIPKGKFSMGGTIKVSISSSSKGRITLMKGEEPLQAYPIKLGDQTVKIKQPIAPADYSLKIKNEDGLVKRSDPWRVRYPTLEMGSRGKEVRLLHEKLNDLGYGNAPTGSTWNEYTSLALLAFRKTNGLSFEAKASPEVLRMLLEGRGAFPLREKREGKYVEVDLARQVMVLAQNGKPEMTYHISSGTPSTPSDLGRYTFYSKVPGYNAIGMYYSVFYNRGEATHGYASVPDYPASHGCIRNPIPSSLEIYNWIPLGAPIWVY